MQEMSSWAPRGMEPSINNSAPPDETKEVTDADNVTGSGRYAKDRMLDSGVLSAPFSESATEAEKPTDAGVTHSYPIAFARALTPIVPM